MDGSHHPVSNSTLLVSSSNLAAMGGVFNSMQDDLLTPHTGHNGLGIGAAGSDVQPTSKYGNNDSFYPLTEQQQTAAEAYGTVIHLDGHVDSSLIAGQPVPAGHFFPLTYSPKCAHFTWIARTKL
jgi:hypothetical protein